MTNSADSSSAVAASLATEKYVSLTTYTRDGTPKPLPVWIVGLPDGRLGFTTSGESWKARRVRNNPLVTMRPCDQRGNVADDAIEVSGTGEIVEGPVFEHVAQLIKAKYGAWVTVIKLLNTVRGLVKREETQSSSAFVITVGDG